MKKTYFLVFVSIMFLVSCVEENPGPNCGTMKFSWKEDGTYYEGNADTYFSSFLENYSITACISGPDAPNVNLRLHAPIAVGTYSLGHVQQATGPNTGDASYFDEGGGGYFTTDSTHLGTVTITSAGASNAITGTFNMSLYRYSTNSTHTITEGQFTSIN